MNTIEILEFTIKEDKPTLQKVITPKRKEKKIKMEEKEKQYHYIDKRIDQIKEEVLKSNKDIISDLNTRLIKCEAQCEAFKKAHNQLVRDITSIFDALHGSINSIEGRVSAVELDIDASLEDSEENDL